MRAEKKNYNAVIYNLEEADASMCTLKEQKSKTKQYERIYSLMNYITRRGANSGNSWVGEAGAGGRQKAQGTVGKDGKCMLNEN